MSLLPSLRWLVRVIHSGVSRYVWAEIDGARPAGWCGVAMVAPLLLFVGELDCGVCCGFRCGSVVILLLRMFVWVGTEIYLVQAGRGFITFQ